MKVLDARGNGIQLSLAQEVVTALEESSLRELLLQGDPPDGFTKFGVACVPIQISNTLTRGLYNTSLELSRILLDPSLILSSGNRALMTLFLVRVIVCVDRI